MFIVGLTGGIGAGKSLICRYFSELGVPIIDADEIARALMGPAQTATDEIKQIFGNLVFDQKGHLDRKKLGQIVFTDPAKLQQLESILHPRVRAEIRDQISTHQTDYLILCVPLLLEKNYQKLIHRILVVDISPELQRQRVQKRDGLRKEEVDAIINQQMPGQERLNQADDVIDNNGSMDEVRHKVFALHKQYQKMAKDSNNVDRNIAD